MANNKINKYLSLLTVNKKKILIIGIPVITLAICAGSYFIYENTKKTNISSSISPPPPPIIPDEVDAIFPEIKTFDFYDLIEFKNGKPIIGDKMIASIVKSIVSRLGTTNGDISFYIEDISDVNKNIFFKWVYENKQIKKTYNILINGL